MKEWFTIPELAELRLPDLPTSVRGLLDIAERNAWKDAGEHRARKVAKRGGGFEYHFSLLPHRAQVTLSAMASREKDLEASREVRKRAFWAAFEKVSDDDRRICHARHAVIMAVENALATNKATGNHLKVKAILERVLGENGVPVATYYDWKAMLKGVEQEDWLPALMPKYVASGEVKEFGAGCHPQAWTAFKSDYLRAEGSGFSACYRRMKEAAKKHGWAPIPSERSLRRRLDVEVTPAVQIYARKGKKAAEQLYPPQVRTKAHLRAMEIVNTDGHKLDLFVWAPWNTKTPVRVILLAIQDIFSGKILSWRLSSAETWDVVRACIGDMIEDFGIPDHFFMDNGRAFASKAISEGAVNRNRFRKKKVNRFGIVEEEVDGILKNFGIEPHFTRPYAGQSKPIERAWKDLAEEIAKHPSMSGCYTGNKPDAKPENYRKRAVALDVLQSHVAERIAEHNSRTGRKTETAKGRSFDETFEASMRLPSTIVRRATDAQRVFWLLAEHVARVRSIRAEIHYMENIYWSDTLTAWRGKKVKIRFDPERLHDPVKVYAPDGRFICEAPCTEKGRFVDTEAAHIHNRNRRTFLKLQKAMLDMHRALSPDEVSDLYQPDPDAAKPTAPIRPAITRIVAGNLAIEQEEVADAISGEEFEARLQRGLSIISGDSSIIPFPSGNSKSGMKPGRSRAEK
ncbi:MAG: Mu transposase C-terminal domain-containing protein [Agrobacterium cavarae]